MIKKSIMTTLVAAVSVIALAACSGGGGTAATTTTDTAQTSASEAASDSKTSEAVVSDFPKGDIEVIVPKNPGGGTDTSTRGLLQFMSENNPALKFNVTNNSDGGGITGMLQTSAAKPDGYTLGAVTVELDMFPFQGKSDLTFEAFDAIAMPIAAPAALIVQGDAPYNSVDEFVAYCKENPGTVQVGNSGAGAINLTDRKSVV